MIKYPAESISQLKKWLSIPQKVLIVSHFNPDGDALGSTLALKLYLEKLGHTAQCIYPSGFPSYYNWIPDQEKALIYRENTKVEIAQWFQTCDLIFCLDFNSSDRINDMSSLLVDAKAPKIVIDHHEQPAPEFDIYLSYPGTSSTCELIYNFIVQFTSKEDLDLDIAACLYTGLITDTGGFQFSSTHSSTHIMASELISLGLQAQEIYNNCFNNFSLNRLKLFGHCIAHNMKIFEDKGLAYIWIDHKTKHKFDIKDGDTEGLVNYPLKVDNIKVSILFKEDKDKIRISFRSKNDVDVSHISREYFSGGGHKNASGGSSKKNLTDTLTYFESLIPSIF